MTLRFIMSYGGSVRFAYFHFMANMLKCTLISALTQIFRAIVIRKIHDIVKMACQIVLYIRLIPSTTAGLVGLVELVQKKLIWVKKNISLLPFLTTLAVSGETYSNRAPATQAAPIKAFHNWKFMLVLSKKCTVSLRFQSKVEGFFDGY